MGVEQVSAERSMIGYVIVDAETNAIDWDAELHPTRDAAIASLTGPRHMYCKSVDEETDEKTYWGRHYAICTVNRGQA